MRKRKLQKKGRCLNNTQASTFILLLETLSKQFEIFLANRLTRRVRFGIFFCLLTSTVPARELLIHRNVAIYGVATLQACDDGLTSYVLLIG